MSFSYNEELCLEANPMAENALMKIQKETIIENIQNVALELITLKGLKKEFHQKFEVYHHSFEVTGEYIKNYFVIVLNGIQKAWKKLACEQATLHPYKEEPLYENVFGYIDLLIDEINFDELFESQLHALNQR